MIHRMTDVAAWTEASATSAAFLVAAMTYRGQARRALRHQAGCIAVTVAWQEPVPRASAMTAIVQVANYSQFPIYEVELRISALGKLSASLAHDVLPPGSVEKHESAPITARAGRPGEALNGASLTGSVCFIDMNGYRWKKFIGGRLESIAPPPRLDHGYEWRKRLIPAWLRHPVRDRWRRYARRLPHRVW
jgi:hypothetical protein